MSVKKGRQSSIFFPEDLENLIQEAMKKHGVVSFAEMVRRLSYKALHEEKTNDGL